MDPRDLAGAPTGIDRQRQKQSSELPDEFLLAEVVRRKWMNSLRRLRIIGGRRDPRESGAKSIPRSTLASAASIDRLRWDPIRDTIALRRHSERRRAMPRKTALAITAGLCVGLCGMTLPQEGNKPADPKKAQQIVDGRLSGFDLPADWKLADGAKKLTYTNPYRQNLAPRWVDGEIVYRVSFGEVKVDPKSTKVAKEYIAVYSAPGPGDPPTKVERVPDQLAIYDTKPGDPGYSPIWHYHYVVVPRDYKANTLRSEKQVVDGGFKIVPVDHFTN
jgi:hypothetical protein